MSNIQQVGGTHYSQTEYQHWDWANDLQLSYPVAAATKYLYRYPCKGTPLIDLQKAETYLQFQLKHWRGKISSIGFISIDIIDLLPWPKASRDIVVEVLMGDVESGILKLQKLIQEVSLANGQT